MSTFQKGTRAIWKPVKARAKCYGHPIATAPVPVEILNGPDRNGHYAVKVLCNQAKSWLNKSRYTVGEAALVLG
ncbi:MAG: hypothetical protein IPJ84_18995 [Bdellovibrionales bacterium]|nr:hypothetical protein [Bdellovibrionales bacterium]